MIRKIDIPVKDKVFKANDILRLADVLYTQSRNRSSNKRVSFELRLPDGSSFEFKDEKPDKLKPILSTKKVKLVALDYYDFTNDTSVSVRLDDSSGWGSISIQAGSTTRYNNLKAAMEDVLGSVKPQQNFYLQNRKIIVHFARLYFGFLVIELIFIVIAHLGIKPVKHRTHTEIDVGSFIQTYWLPLIILFSYTNGFLWSDLFTNYMDKLWPSIEFDFGPTHLRISRQKRKTAAFIATVIVIPVLLQVAFIWL